MRFTRFGDLGRVAAIFLPGAVAATIVLLTSSPLAAESAGGGLAGRPTAQGMVVEPVRVAERVNQGGYLRLELDTQEFDRLKHGAAERLVRLALPDSEPVVLEMTRFHVFNDETKFVVAGSQGDTEISAPDVVTLRGSVSGDSHSTAYLALGASGIANGYIETAGRNYVISSARSEAGQRAGQREITIHRSAEAFALPEFDTFCGVASPEHPVEQSVAPRGGLSDHRGVRLARVAIECDEEYVGLFGGNVTDAEAYVVQLMGAVSNIYIRDLNTKLLLTFVRLWPSGGEPFEATDVFGFYEYYTENEPWFYYNYVHLFSGRRDTGYGGIAFVGGTCQGFAYGVSAFMLGGFPSPVGQTHLGNWDVIVVAHEMGHNSGTYHTHDGYTPAIDNCGNGTPSRGTIMSYCHTFPGGVTNTQLFMHRQVEDVIEAELLAGGCFDYDCNNNGVRDMDDIDFGFSLDTNFNGIPDECEDCNNNGIIDEEEIFLGAPDVNGNFILDECEPDCNDNGIPDPYECDLNPANDVDGNNVPDECDPDCNNNGVLDWADVNSGGFVDVDRDFTPDVCQDCNGNGIVDWMELGRGDNLFVADRSNYIREYYSTSGYPVMNHGAGVLIDPYDCVFGADRQLYVASFSNDRIVRLNVDTGAAVDFVPAGSGGLDGPSSLVFGPNGNLFVASRLTGRILEYDGGSGAFVQVFTADIAAAGTQPFGMTFGPDGDLYVGCSNNSVRRYDGTTGALVGVFVSVGSGSLSDPRGLLFLPSGNLLVASFGNSSLREYDGATGAFVRVFNQSIAVDGAWGLRMGPAGNVFAVRSMNGTRVYEYNLDGVLMRSYVRGDGPLPTPTGLDFRTGFVSDCNANFVLDTCDPEWSDIALFAETLLTSPPDPVLACMYDRNGDASLDARDIQPFIDGLAP